MKLIIIAKGIFSDLLFVLSTLLANITAFSKITDSMLKERVTGSVTF